MMAISDRGLGTVTTSTNPDYLCSAQIMRYTLRERQTHTQRDRQISNNYNQLSEI